MAASPLDQMQRWTVMRRAGRAHHTWQLAEDQSEDGLSYPQDPGLVRESTHQDGPPTSTRPPKLNGGQRPRGHIGFEFARRSRAREAERALEDACLRHFGTL